MKFTLPLMKETPGTMVFGNKEDITLPINQVYVRKGSSIDKTPVEDLKSITITLSK